MIQTNNIFITGGAGTLGKAIAKRRKEEGWTGRLTVYSTDAGKHNALRRAYPDVTCIQGDIRNGEVMRLAMLGHEIVIHAAAVKFIPNSEYASIDTIDVNVYGSEVVCEAARWAGVRHVLGISTDKACHPANAYGASKMLMEKVFQEQARYDGETHFNLVRYGNVLESRGSVIEAWRNSVANEEPVHVTDPEMTRFWLSPSQAVDYVIKSLGIPSGRILIPIMPGLSMQRMLEYVFKDTGIMIKRIPMRPGEKLHETLLTEEETEYVEYYPASEGKPSYWVLHPSTNERLTKRATAYTSQVAHELTEEELEELLKG